MSINFTVSSSNTTQTSPVEGQDVLKIVQYILFAAIFVVSVLGNILVCLVIRNTRSMRNTRNYLIMNLAVADLTVALVCIPFDVALQAHAGPWPLGEFLCRIIWPAMTLVTQCSAATLAAISFDRFRAVVYPTKPRFSRKQTSVIIASTWVLSLLLVLPYVLVLKIDGGQCTEEWPSENHRHAYTACLFVFQYCLPLTIIAFAYTRVALKLRHQANRISRNRTSSSLMPKKSKGEQDKCLMMEDVSSFGAENTSSPVKTASKLTCKPCKDLPSTFGKTHSSTSRPSTPSQEQRRLEHNTKIIKMLVSVVMTYALCLLPNQVVWMWNDFGTGSKYRYINELITFSSIMVYINSSTNPLLYAGMNEEFRKGFARFLRCCKRKQRKDFV